MVVRPTERRRLLRELGSADFDRLPNFLFMVDSVLTLSSSLSKAAMVEISMSRHSDSVTLELPIGVEIYESELYKEDEHIRWVRDDGQWRMEGRKARPQDFRLRNMVMLLLTVTASRCASQ